MAAPSLAGSIGFCPPCSISEPPMKTIGAGVRELRIRDRSGAFRVIYLATLADRVVVLHAFQKKTQRTAKSDIEVAVKRFRELRKD